MKLSALFVLIITCLLFATTVSAEQKIIFKVESISYKSGTGSDFCQGICDLKQDRSSIDEMLSQGWRIISSSPKEVIGDRYHYYKHIEPTGCTCIGNQYVLQKDDPIPIEKPDVSSKKEELLKKEIELLKRENDLLKQENKNLKNKLKLK
jgi:hypothetical protein